MLPLRLNPLTSYVKLPAACFLWFVILSPISQSTRAQQIPPSSKLDRFEPLTPEQALDSFEVADGFRIELVAAEPLVVDPVAFCFDAAGRMIVVEMRGYSERPDDQMGQIRRLTDSDGDGVMDHGETLAEGLSWPTAVECFQAGVVVATAPDLINISQGSKEILCTGFGKTNVQGLVNSLRYGLDLRLHGATSSSGAEIVGLGHNSPFRLGGRDFAIDFKRQTLVPTSGGAQHGMMIDAWGDKYVCSNSDHLQQILITSSRPHRANALSFEPASRRSIAVDGPQAEVFRSSPVEPWRILRTHLRVTGQASGPIEGGGRAAGYFTGATGVWIYEDEQWPKTTYPIALVCDVGSNLIHRKHLIPDGLFNKGKRIDVESELLRSTDTWFRPVQLGGGPDGGLYIADMYREVIEHPKSLPPIIKSQVDLNSGNDRGRIWRLVSTKNSVARKHQDLSNATITELVAAIDSNNSWKRRTAARLVYERFDTSAVPLIADVAIDGQYPAGRLQALSLLHQMLSIATELSGEQANNAFHFKTLASATNDPHPRIRQRAVEYLASLPSTNQYLAMDHVRSLATDSSIQVRFQLAYDAARLVPDKDERARLLYEIAKQDATDPHIRWAVEGSLQTAAGPFFELLIQQPKPFLGEQQAWLTSCLYQLLRQQDAPSTERDIAKLVSLLKDSPDETGAANTQESALWSSLVLALDRLPTSDSNQTLVQWAKLDLLSEIREHITQSEPTTNFVSEKLALLRWAAPQDAQELLEESLLPETSVSWKQIAIQELAGFDADSASIISQRLTSFTPRIQQLAVDRLAQSKAGQTRLLEQVVAETIPLRLLPTDLQSTWLNDPAISSRLPGQGRGSSSPAQETNQLLATYASFISDDADVAIGENVFKKNCAACHKKDPNGNQIGPELKSVIEKGSDQILLAIIDPNREVDPKFRTVKVLTVYGKLVSGIVADESENRLRIIDAQGTDHRIARSDIERLETTNKSLMPEGLHETITPSEMNHLIHYLRQRPNE